MPQARFDLGAHTSPTSHCSFKRDGNPSPVAVKRFRRGTDRVSFRPIDSVEEDMTASPIWPDCNLVKAEADARVTRRRLARWWPQQTIAWAPALTVASLALVFVATGADARGGRSHGRRMNAAVLSNPSSTPATTTSVPTQAAQPSDPPAQPTVSFRNVGVIAVPPPPPPAHTRSSDRGPANPIIADRTTLNHDLHRRSHRSAHRRKLWCYIAGNPRRRSRGFGGMHGVLGRRNAHDQS
jgi:hypothetical protein